jgi:hypothetical protein
MWLNVLLHVGHWSLFFPEALATFAAKLLSFAISRSPYIFNVFHAFSAFTNIKKSALYVKVKRGLGGWLEEVARNQLFSWFKIFLNREGASGALICWRLCKRGGPPF